MAKVIRYQFLSGKVNRGTEENPYMVPILRNKSLGWSEANEEIAKHEAYNGEYSVEEIEVPPVAEPTADEILNAMLGVM